jgi:hypothetical protein
MIDRMHDTSCFLGYPLDSSRAGRQAVTGKRSAGGSTRSLCYASLLARADATSVTAPAPLVRPEAVLPASAMRTRAGRSPSRTVGHGPCGRMSSLIILWRESDVAY